MASYNEITGDKIETRGALSKKGEEAYEQIFGKRKTNGGWKPPLAPLAPLTAQDPLCEICGKSLSGTKECAWTSCPLNWDEKRADIIGQNGNIGYGEE